MKRLDTKGPEKAENETRKMKDACSVFFRQKVSPALLPEQSVQKSSSELEQRARRARTTRRLKIRAKVKKHSIKLST